MNTRFTVIAAIAVGLAVPVWANAAEFEADVEIESDVTSLEADIESESSAFEIRRPGSKSSYTRTYSTHRQDVDVDDALEEIPEAFEEIPEAFDDAF